MATCFSGFPRSQTGTWATESVCSANSPARLKTDATEAPRAIDEARLWVEEAFAEFDVPTSSNAKVALRLGRQEFEFGSGRLVDVREEHPDLALLGADVPAHPRHLVAHPIQLCRSHSALRSSGTSPNLRSSVASLKSPLNGLPVRENATAPA